MTKTTTLIVLADRWGSHLGGVNAFNYDLCRGIAEAWDGGGTTICAVTNDASPEEKQFAKLNQVHIRHIKRIVHKKSTPEIVRGEEIDHDLCQLANECSGDLYWLGHDIFTGFAACAAAEKFGGKSAVIRHMDRFAFSQKKGASSEEAVSLEAEQADVLKRAEFVFAVGPLLKESVEKQHLEVCEILPGLIDTSRIPAPKVSGNSTLLHFHGFTAGRLNMRDDTIKQSRLAVAGFAAAAEEIVDIAQFSIVCMGLSDDEEKKAAEQSALSALAESNSKKAVQVTALSFQTDRAAYSTNMAKSGCVLHALNARRLRACRLGSNRTWCSVGRYVKERLVYRIARARPRRTHSRGAN